MTEPVKAVTRVVNLLEELYTHHEDVPLSELAPLTGIDHEPRAIC